MKTPRRSSRWQDPTDATPGPVQSGVRERVLPADERPTAENLESAPFASTDAGSSNERITARPPPLDFEDECSAQTVMRKLPAEFLAKLKQHAEAAGDAPEIELEDEVTQVASIQTLEQMSAFTRLSDPDTEVDPGPFVATPVEVVSPPTPARVPDTAPPPRVALELPELRPTRDVLPYILLGLGLGLAILLAVFHGH